MKKYFLLIFIPVVFLSQIPTGYYDETAGLSGYALKSKLHDIISPKTVCYNYSDVAALYKTTDVDRYYENDGSVLDIYSENPLGADAYVYDFTQNIGSTSAEGQGWNKEHGVPQSTFYGIYPMYSDLHYLIPADAYINQRRSNYPYARNSGSALIYSNGSKLGKSTTPGYSNTVYEPIDEFKGDVARYLLYFVVRYEGYLNHFNYLLSTSPLDGSEEKAYEDWYIAMLKDWNALDPVSQKEIDRNNAVYNIEKTRNPFVDHPEWVDAIWSETADTVAPSAPQNLTSMAIGESYVTLTWSASPEADVLGYKIYVDGEYYGYSKTNSLSVDRLSSDTAYNFTVKAYDKGYLFSPESNTYTANTLETDTLAKDLMISKYIEGSFRNRAIEITNKTGHAVDLSNYYLSIQYDGEYGYYFPEAFQLEGILQPNSVIVAINTDAALPTFPVSQADFVTNAPPLTFAGHNYIVLSYGTKYLKTASTNNYSMYYTAVDAIGFKDVSNANADVSLYRNSDVTDPNVDFTMSEWTSYLQDYAVDLGVFKTLSSNEVHVAANINIYPNPVLGGKLFISGDGYHKIKTAKIFGIDGRLVLKIENPFGNSNFINVMVLKSGLYVLNLNGQIFKFIKK